MIVKKPIFIIPGYKHKPTDSPYRKIAKLLQSEGYSPILVRISWERATISENAEYFLQVYNSVRAEKKHILGFSFGAIIAFIAATKVEVSGLILCSLSPYFKEDLSDSLPLQMTEQYKDFLRLSCLALAKQVKARQTHMLYGAREERSLIQRVTEVFDQISSNQKYLTAIKDTEHEIGDRKYLRTIHQVVQNL